MLRWAAGVAAAVLLVLAGPAPAHADEADTAYRDAFVRGTERFEAEDWAAARAAFERAYALRPTPLLLFNIGSTYRREGRLREALGYYRRYLAEAPADAEYRQLALRVVSELEAALAGEPGHGDPAEAVPDAIAADEPKAQAAPAPAQVEARPQARGRGWKLGGALTAAAGVLALGYGGYQGYRSRAAADELRELSDGTSWSAAHQERWDEGEAAERRAIAGSIAGGVLVIGGAALYFIGSRRDAAERPAPGQVTVAPVVGPSWQGLALGGRF